MQHHLALDYITSRCMGWIMWWVRSRGDNTAEERGGHRNERAEIDVGDIGKWILAGNKSARNGKIYKLESFNSSACLARMAACSDAHADRVVGEHLFNAHCKFMFDFISQRNGTQTQYGCVVVRISAAIHLLDVAARQPSELLRTNFHL